MALPAHPVVIDNTTLSNFALVGRADLVTGLWGERASTTSLVMNEYLAGVEGGILSPDIWDDLPLLELTEDESTFQAGLPSRLGAGEGSCLAVACRRQGILVTDDKVARKEARRVGTSVTGSVGVLVLCVRQGLLSLDEGNRLLESMIDHKYRSPVDKLDDLL